MTTARITPWPCWPKKTAIFMNMLSQLAKKLLTQKEIKAYEENAKEADPGLREIRWVIALLQQAHEIFTKKKL